MTKKNPYLNPYLEQLMKEVLKRSQAADWLLAVMEWRVDKVEEDESQSTSCVCGKENLRWLFTIKNDITGSEMFPIGSRCIKRFGRPDLNADAALKLEFFKLLRAVENNRPSKQTLTAGFIRKKIISLCWRCSTRAQKEMIIRRERQPRLYWVRSNHFCRGCFGRKPAGRMTGRLTMNFYQ